MGGHIYRSLNDRIREGPHRREMHNSFPSKCTTTPTSILWQAFQAVISADVDYHYMRKASIPSKALQHYCATLILLRQVLKQEQIQADNSSVLQDTLLIDRFEV